MRIISLLMCEFLRISTAEKTDCFQNRRYWLVSPIRCGYDGDCDYPSDGRLWKCQCEFSLKKQDMPGMFSKNLKALQIDELFMNFFTLKDKNNTPCPWWGQFDDSKTMTEEKLKEMELDFLNTYRSTCKFHYASKLSKSWIPPQKRYKSRKSSRLC